MCDLTWDEVKVTHEQLNIPDPSISNPGLFPGAQQLLPACEVHPPGSAPKGPPPDPPPPTEWSPGCQSAAAGGGGEKAPGPWR